MAMSFSVREGAHQCGLSERTIHAAIQRGDLSAFRVGRRVLVTPESLQKYLNDGTAKSVGGSRG